MKERRGNKVPCFVTETWLNVLRCFKQFVLLTDKSVENLKSTSAKQMSVSRDDENKTVIAVTAAH
jgi:hypothetical protein